VKVLPLPSECERGLLSENKETIMKGLMQDWPLLLSKVLTFAARGHGEAEIVSRSVEGPIHRTTYAELHRRSSRISLARSPSGGCRMT
jgi:hypothetical protein